MVAAVVVAAAAAVTAVTAVAAVVAVTAASSRAPFGHFAFGRGRCRDPSVRTEIVTERQSIGSSRSIHALKQKPFHIRIEIPPMIAMTMAAVTTRHVSEMPLIINIIIAILIFAI